MAIAEKLGADIVMQLDHAWLSSRAFLCAAGC
jgi:queuine/archaeosine tRNA-ribosyltransferase